MFYKLLIFFLITKLVLSQDKPGTCPPNKLPSDTATICLAKCSGDDSCPGAQKCCNYGCMTQCADPVNTIGMYNIPKCHNTPSDRCATMLCSQCSLCRDGKCVPQKLCPVRCPEILLAAPQEGCHYESDVDANGCVCCHRLVCSDITSRWWDLCFIFV
jgi:hypothetical protein